jgi:bifunctional non-homologous end joining protein LigD
MATAPRLTSAERVVFPDAGITKGDVADYYRAVSRWLLPDLVQRPLSLVRCPDGIAGSCFFQKHHADSLGAHVHSIRLREVEGEDDYLYVDDIEGVLELVQMNTLEFHVWGARVADTERPDRLVFDLDPAEGIEWNALKAAARDVRDQLAAQGLRSWVRLSGGKGVHVVAPIRPGPDWSQAKAFCEAFADLMVKRSPGRYIATASKAAREGLIFIDWLRNTRGATSVTNWSLRAREGAPVAVPLTWEDLGRVRQAGAFDLHKAQRRARTLRRDPWHGFHRARQSLPARVE